MRVLRFRDDGTMRLIIYCRSVHLFVYRWGVTVRARRGDDWRHVSLRCEGDTYPETRMARLTVSAETWRTLEGTTERARFSKRYVKLKVLA